SLAAKADTDTSTGVSKPSDVETPGEASGAPRMFVVSIGATAADAVSSQSLAKYVEGQTSADFSEVQVRSLVRPLAPPRGIDGELEGLKKHITNQDVAVIYFKGNVAIDAKQMLYLLPSDGSASNLANTAYSSSRLLDSMQTTPGRILFLLDTSSTAVAKS